MPKNSNGQCRMIYVNMFYVKSFRKLSHGAGLTWIYLFTIADDWGRHLLDMEEISDDLSCSLEEANKWIQENVDAKHIALYEGPDIEDLENGIKQYYYCPRWGVYQSFRFGKSTAECPNPDTGLFEFSQNSNYKRGKVYRQVALEKARSKYGKFLDESEPIIESITSSTLEAIKASQADIRTYVTHNGPNNSPHNSPHNGPNKFKTNNISDKVVSLNGKEYEKSQLKEALVVLEHTLPIIDPIIDPIIGNNSYSNYNLKSNTSQKLKECYKVQTNTLGGEEEELPKELSKKEREEISEKKNAFFKGLSDAQKLYPAGQAKENKEKNSAETFGLDTTAILLAEEIATLVKAKVFTDWYSELKFNLNKIEVAKLTMKAYLIHPSKRKGANFFKALFRAAEKGKRGEEDV